MRGMILKDIMISKRTLQFYFAILVVGIVISPFIDVGGYLMLYAALLGVMIPLQTMTDDEKNRWNQYVTALPVARNKIAICKYILAFFCIGLSYLGLYIGCFLSETMRLGLPIEMILGSMGFAVLYTIITIPLALKYGTVKSRILILVVFYIPMILLFATSQLGIDIDYLGLLERYVYMIPVIYVLLIATSMGISVRICNGKDF